MALTIGSNIASLQAQRRLFQQSDQLSSVFERLSSGQRINRASDDAAGLAIASTLSATNRVYNQGVRNFNDGVSLLNIADSALSNLSGIVTRLKELATQAANGSLSNEQRGALDIEAQELREEYFRIAQSTEFNDVNLFDGSLGSGITFQGGFGSDGGIFSGIGGEIGTGEFGSGITNSMQASDMAFGDINSDGILDLVGSVPGSFIEVAIGNGDGTFQDATNVGSGAGNTQEVQLADFNNDGILDIAASAATAVNIALGNGDGTFQAVQTFMNVGSALNGLDFGDLNGDGNLDLVATSAVGAFANVILGNGDGTFGTALSVSTALNTADVNLNDFNGDGILDILSVASTGSANLALGNGDGTFGTANLLLWGGDPRDIAVGDLNGDGNLDVVNANQTENSVSYRLGNGDGTFQARITVSTGGSSSSIELGDINGDGNDDIVVGSTFPQNVSVILNNGDGTFGSATSFSVGTTVIDVGLADLDGDGVLDITASANLPTEITSFLGESQDGVAPLLEFSLRTKADALQALAPLDRKLDQLSAQRGEIGAFQSRLATATRVLEVSAENVATAESRIRDADIADETSNLVRLNILQQATAAVLAQANQQPALALELLG